MTYLHRLSARIVYTFFFQAPYLRSFRHLSGTLFEIFQTSFRHLSGTPSGPVRGRQGKRAGEQGLEGGAGRHPEGGGRRQRGRREGEGAAAQGKGHNSMSE